MVKQALIIYNPSSVTQVGPDAWLGEIVHRICFEGGYKINANDLIVAAGGDGTIRLVLGTLAHLKSTLPVAIMPLGTGNQLARNLSIYEDHLLVDSIDKALDI